MSVPGDFGRLTNGAPSEEWGNAIRYGWIDGAGETAEQQHANGTYRAVSDAGLTAFLRFDAEKVLPPGTRYEIREATPWNYGRSRARAWYASAGMAGEPLWAMSAGTSWAPAPFPGYTLLGRFVTPAEPGLRAPPVPWRNDVPETAREYRLWVADEAARVPPPRWKRWFGRWLCSDYGREPKWMDHIRAIRRWWRGP